MISLRVCSPGRTSDSQARIDRSVAALDAWLDTMRAPGGYTGPVSHWWQQCFSYTGVGLDWRYEGIIIGYLHLWKRSGDRVWLEKARTAGNDLVRGQTPDGFFAGSAFELNPASGGTPHEAACDVALYSLAIAMRDAGESGWEAYVECANRNLESYYLGKLWNSDTRSFHDAPDSDSFVPNKAATAVEAVIWHSLITREDTFVSRYAVPTLDRILTHQSQAPAVGGAIAQNTYGGRRVEKYFPIYIARCVPGLVLGSQVTGDKRYLDAAAFAMDFIKRQVGPDGSLPTVVYPGLRTSGRHQWIAPLGDVLRAADVLRDAGHSVDVSVLLDTMLDGQDETGGIQTARGFGSLGRSRRSHPDVRDVLRVAGWCDKSFRYLAAHCSTSIPIARSGSVELTCQLNGKDLVLTESPSELVIRERGTPRYVWQKGSSWPSLVAPEFWIW